MIRHVRRLPQLLSDFLERLDFCPHVHAPLHEVSRQQQAALDGYGRCIAFHSFRGWQDRGPRIVSGERPRRVLACTALCGEVAFHGTIRFGVESHLVDFDLVEMQASLARQLDPHVPCRGSSEIDDQRLAVRVAVEHCSVVLIDLLPLVAVAGDQDREPRSPAGRVVASVVDVNLIQPHGPLQIDLPPGVVFQGRVESPLSIHDSVAPAGGVFLCSNASRASYRNPTNGVFEEPVGFELPCSEDCRLSLRRNRI